MFFEHETKQAVGLVSAGGADVNHLCICRGQKLAGPGEAEFGLLLLERDAGFLAEQAAEMARAAVKPWGEFCKGEVHEFGGGHALEELAETGTAIESLGLGGVLLEGALEEIGEKLEELEADRDAGGGFGGGDGGETFGEGVIGRKDA